MIVEMEFVTSGSVTAPQGFQAGAVHAGIKKNNVPDLGILFSETPCLAAGLFTTNRVKAAPVVLCRQRLQSGRIRAVVVNSGCANACTGERGMADAVEMAAMAAGVVGVPPDEVLVASTGVIGQLLPMERLRAGMSRIVLSRYGGHTLAKAIMTTDTTPKEAAIRVEAGGFTIGGVAKGSGMIHPDLATMLCFLSTDASVDLDFLRVALREAADVSFNMLSVDGDTSTNDTVLLLANGTAGNEIISEGSRHAAVFQQALNRLCIYLAKAIAGDGEGATRLLEVTVSGAPGLAEARRAARTIVSSALVKTAIHGGDPNWGRVIAALGRSGVDIVEEKIDFYLGEICLAKGGCAFTFNEEEAIKALNGKEVSLTVNLNLGSAAATAWGCDLTEEYVVINSEYTT